MLTDEDLVVTWLSALAEDAADRREFSDGSFSGSEVREICDTIKGDELYVEYLQFRQLKNDTF